VVYLMFAVGSKKARYSTGLCAEVLTDPVVQRHSARETNGQLTRLLWKVLASLLSGGESSEFIFKIA
jgi:hypothetical protein